MLHKAPDAAYADREFAREARHVTSATFVAHVRFASTGALADRNTHPFQQDGRLFAHNGVIEGLDDLDAELGPDLARVTGDTDSERFFALISRETARHGGDVTAGITAAARWIAARLPLFSLNLSSPPPTACGRCATPTPTNSTCCAAPPAATTAAGTSTTPSDAGRLRARPGPRRAPRSSSPANAWTTTRTGGS